MTEEKITISWDDLKTRQVDQRIGAMNAVKRNRDYASLTDAPEPVAPAAMRNFFYNTIVYMTIFGFVGGFLAWGCWTLLHFKGSVRNEAFAQMERVKEIRQNPKLTDQEKSIIVEQLARDGRNNPYFVIYSDAHLTNDEKATLTSRVEARDRRKEFISNVLAYGVTGMLIAIMLSIAEPAVSRNVPSAIVNGSVGATMGLLGGICVALFVERMYKALGGQDGMITSSQQIMARVAQWAVVGLFLTIGPGLVMRSFKKLIIGAIGGVLGGVVGGLVFDPIGMLAHSEDLSRLVGLVAIGAVAGAAVGLIENAAKSGWLKVTAGLIAGKQFILYRNPTFIGSSPDNQIYLFKDTNVGRRHAAIHIVRGGFEIQDLPLGVATLINGRPITRTRLRSGDQLQIGATRFVFQEKQPSNLASQN
jgi:hypothetical protein